MKVDVLVVGAGPAGMMAAGVSAQRGLKTILLDKNMQMGRKLRITGKGRCNITNDCSPEEVIASVTVNQKFLYSALHQFPPEEVKRFFNDLGVSLKTERGKRVFPVSDDANEVADAMAGFAKQNGVDYQRTRVKRILEADGGIIGVQTDQDKIKAQCVILACGGASYPGTGSNGDGARLAAQVGHHIFPLQPSLVPLVAKGDICAQLQGLSLRNCALTVYDRIADAIVFHDFGELIFTHFGLSGPIALSASAHMRKMKPDRYSVEIDLKPALDEQKLSARLVRDFQENKNKVFANSLNQLFPQKLIPVMVNLSGISPETRCNAITKEQRARFAWAIKHVKIDIQSFRPINEAIVTAGGVSTREVDPKTMASKRIKGLYFAGEILDLDAYTGGFNLQIAFSTGFVAGNSVSR